MKDQLEDFIASNRSAFDDREVPEGVWGRIDRAVFPVRALWNSVNLWRAAAVVFMAISAWLIFGADRPAPADTTALKEFQDVEQFYTHQISQKFHLIDQFRSHDGVNGFTHDFQQLEAMYEVLKEEMRVRPSQKVRDALVLNLLVRIDLLNKHLHELEQLNGDGAPMDGPPRSAS